MINFWYFLVIYWLLHLDYYVRNVKINITLRNNCIFILSWLINVFYSCTANSRVLVSEKSIEMVSWRYYSSDSRWVRKLIVILHTHKCFSDFLNVDISKQDNSQSLIYSSYRYFEWFLWILIVWTFFMQVNSFMHSFVFYYGIVLL